MKQPRSKRGSGVAVTFILVAFLAVASSKKDEEEKREPCVRADRGSLKRYNHTEMFGNGLEKAIPLNETTCFMISPRDKNGEVMDRHCEPATTNWVVLISSVDGRIQTRAAMMFLPHEGFHMACYQVREPAKYLISVYLTSLDHARSLSVRNASAASFPFQLVKSVKVTAKTDRPNSYARRIAKYEASLPVCTAEVLGAWRGSEGRWIDNRWHPFSCRINRVTPEHARKCLAGKRVLMVGDTQQLAQYATTLAYLSSSDECMFSSDLGGPSAIPNIRCDKTRLNGPTPFRPNVEGDQKVGVHRTEFNNGVSVTFYGTAVNGFAIGRVPQFGNTTSVRPRRTRRHLLWQEDEEQERAVGSARTRSFRKRRHSADRPGGAMEEGAGGSSQRFTLDARPNVVKASVLSEERLDARRTERLRSEQGVVSIVFVAHTKASAVLYHEWMVDPRRKGPLVYDFSPFDLVLATSGVHDLFLFDAAGEYGQALDDEYMPSLRLAVKGPLSQSVTWMGAWSILQSNLPTAKLSSANAGRAAEFDRETARISKSWNIPFIDMEPLTQSRPDLSIGPAHYSWPVARTMLELWLGNICPEPETTEGSQCS